MKIPYMKVCCVLLALTTSSLPLSSAFAQSTPVYEVVATGKTYRANFSAATRNIKEFSVYFVSEGNSSTAVSVGLQGPQGARIRSRFGFLGSQDAKGAANDIAFGAEGRFRNAASRKELPEVVLTNQGGYSSSSLVTANSWFHLHKDACAGSKRSRYLAKVTVNVANVDPALYQQGFSIVISVQEYRFKGAQVASIKPASDGKYYGEPILLMGTVSYGNEYVNIRRHGKEGAFRSARRIPIVKYVGYRGYGLSLARLKGLLNGGRGTFELSNGGDIYGVCFSLERKRQVRNGYPMEVR